MRGGRRTDPRGHGIMRLITKSGAGREWRRVERKSAECGAPARLYRDPEVLELERKRIFERTWQLAGARVAAAEARHLPHGQGGHPAGARAARRRGRAARLPQRLPPPRLASPRGLGRMRQGDPLPLPRLDLPARRRADRRARGAQHPGSRQVGAGAVPGAGGDDRRARVREPRPARHAAGRAGGRACRSGWRRTRSSGSSRTPPTTARSRPTGRSPPTTTSRATTCRSPIPGLMRLLDYKHYDVEVHDNWVWFEAPLRDKPSGNRMERALPAARVADARPGRGRPARLALRVHLPEHGDRPLSGPRLDLEDRRRRRADHARHRLALPAPGRLAAHAARPARELQGEQGRSATRTSTS